MNIFPSLMAGNLLALAQEIADLELLCAGFHIDCMDFASVGNVTWGPPTVNALANATRKKLWVHLMVQNPLEYLHKMTLRSGDIVSLHPEYAASAVIAQACAVIRNNGQRASIAINPDTPVGTVALFKDQIDHILLMAVKPGASGQKFMPETMERIAELQELVQLWDKKVTIGIDGGINEKNIVELHQARITDITVGSAIFAKNSSIAALQRLVDVVS